MSQPEQFGNDGEPCAACGAPLAGDQRYCLNCGERRGEPKVDYLRYLVPGGPVAAAAGPAEAEPVAPVAGAPAPTTRSGRDYTPLAAAGGVAILGLMLLVGVLIGRGNEDQQQVAATPQVVTVSSAGTATDTDKSAPAGNAAAGAAQDNSGGGNPGADANGKDGGGKSDLTSGGGGAGEDTANPVQASTEDLQALENASGDNYAEQSANLPDTIATPGEPPPVDNEAPGGGSSATTIK